MLGKSLHIKYFHIVAFYTLLVLNFRPSILGEWLGSTFFLGVASIFIFTGFLLNKFNLDNKKIIFNSFYLLIIFYLFLQILLLETLSISGTFNSLLLIFIGFSVNFFMTKESIYLFYRWSIAVLILLSFSYLVSYGLLLLTGSIYPIFNIDLPTVRGGYYSLPIILPFSPIYEGSARVMGMIIPRAIGIMREPGLFQMMVIIFFWLTEYYKIKYYKWIKVLLIILLLFTFSTAGFAIFLLTIFFYWISTQKKHVFFKVIIISLIAIAGFYFLFTTQSQFGIAQKFQNKSGLSRLNALIMAIDFIKSSPFLGIGFHYDPNNNELGINFLGTIAQLGIIGTIIFLLPSIFVGLKVIKVPIIIINMYIPLIITLLLSQPIYDKPITFLFLSLILNLSLIESKNKQAARSNE